MLALRQNYVSVCLLNWDRIVFIARETVRSFNGDSPEFVLLQMKSRAWTCAQLCGIQYWVFWNPRLSPFRWTLRLYKRKGMSSSSKARGTTPALCGCRRFLRWMRRCSVFACRRNTGWKLPFHTPRWVPSCSRWGGRWPTATPTENKRSTEIKGGAHTQVAYY